MAPPAEQVARGASRTERTARPLQGGAPQPAPAVRRCCPAPATASCWPRHWEGGSSAPWGMATVAVRRPRPGIARCCALGPWQWQAWAPMCCPAKQRYRDDLVLTRSRSLLSNATTGCRRNSPSSCCTLFGGLLQKLGSSEARPLASVSGMASDSWRVTTVGFCGHLFSNAAAAAAQLPQVCAICTLWRYAAAMHPCQVQHSQPATPPTYATAALQQSAPASRRWPGRRP